MISTARPITSNLEAREVFQRSLSPNRFVLTLLTLGMISALVEIISYQSSLEAQTGFNADFAGEVVKSPLFYVAYAIQLSCTLFAGFCAMVSLDFRNVTRTFLLRFWLLLAATLLMTARGYTLADLRSFKLADATGPLPFVLSVVAFIGVNRKNWSVLEKVFMLESLALCVLVGFGISKIHVFSREEAIMYLNNYLNALFWPAAWIALRSYPPNSWLRYVRFGPILVYALGSLIVQTRLNMVTLIALLLVHAFIQHRRGVPQGKAWILWGSVVIWLALFVAIFLQDSRAFQRLSSVTQAFSSRLDEDTRTGQLYAFARDVSGKDLLLGRGSFATWHWGRTEWKGGTDVGYLTLLLYGGLPLLLTYFAAHLIPGFRLFGNDIEDWQLPAAGVTVVFAVRMFSSAYPGLNLESYPILLCLGACISRQTLPVYGYFHRRSNDLN